MSTSYLPTICPCQCGSTPAFVHSQHGATRMMRLACNCGNRGAALLYTKPEDRARMVQAGIDGWNLADH
jgi:hypothetical protein